MNDMTEFRDRMRKGYNAKGAPATPMNPAELDEFIKHIYHTGLNDNLGHRLAKFYGMDATELEEMVLGQQLAMVHTLTDFSSKKTRADLEQLLLTQNTQVAEMLSKQRQLLHDVTESLAKAKALYATGFKLLTLLRDQLNVQPPAQS